MHKKFSNGLDSTTIGFGFDRKTDEQSLYTFFTRFAKDHLLCTLIPRLDDEDINATVDFLTGLMNKHFTEKEYHKLFLAE